MVGMRSRMTLACSIGSDLALAHVGGSRAYLMRKGEFQLPVRKGCVRLCWTWLCRMVERIIPPFSIQSL